MHGEGGIYCKGVPSSTGGAPERSRYYSSPGSWEQENSLNLFPGLLIPLITKVAKELLTPCDKPSYWIKPLFTLMKSN